MEFTALSTSRQSPPRVFTTRPKIWLELSCGTTATSRTLPAAAPLRSKTGAPRRSVRASGGIAVNIFDALEKCSANFQNGLERCRAVVRAGMSPYLLADHPEAGLLLPASDRSHRLQLFDDLFQHDAAISQARLEFVVMGLIDLVQQVFVLVLQEFQEELFFLVGQPQFHGDLHVFRGQHDCKPRRQANQSGPLAELPSR